MNFKTHQTYTDIINHCLKIELDVLSSLIQSLQKDGNNNQKHILVSKEVYRQRIQKLNNNNNNNNNG